MLPQEVGLASIMPEDVPKGFYVMCIKISRCTNYVASIVDRSEKAAYKTIWEVDYHLPEKTIAGLPRYIEFKSFEEAAIRCDMLGLKCIKCKWLPYPWKTAYGSWTVPFLPQGTYIPEEGYDEFAEKFYRKKLGEHYDEFMENHPDWRPKTK